MPIYQRVTELIPASPLAFNNLGAALEMTADFSGAAAAFERSLALEPTRSAYSNLGTVYYFLGRYADAAQHVLARHGARRRGSSRVGQPRGCAVADRHRRAEAQSDYRRAILLAQKQPAGQPARTASPGCSSRYYSARAGDTEHVARYASRALELDGADEYVHYYAALVALEAGDTAGALASLSRAVELGYPAQLVRAAPDFISLRSDARFRKLVGPADKSPTA